VPRADATERTLGLMMAGLAPPHGGAAGP